MRRKRGGKPTRSWPSTGRKLADAQQESNRIIEEARRTAEELRAEIAAKAEREAAATVSKAAEEIRAERDRVFQQLRSEVAEIAVGLAGRVVGESLDAKAHQQLIDRVHRRGRHVDEREALR